LVIWDSGFNHAVLGHRTLGGRLDDRFSFSQLV
jgi:hypothetical protein